MKNLIQLDMVDLKKKNNKTPKEFDCWAIWGHKLSSRGVQPSRQPNQPTRSTQSNPTQPNPKFMGSWTYVSWVGLKFLKKNLIIRVVGSTIDKSIKPRATDYYHLIFTKKKI